MFRKLFEEMDDYTGAGGPTEEQVKQNNETLLKALHDKGIDADLEGATDEFEVIQIAPRIFVGYDRWDLWEMISRSKRRSWWIRPRKS